jgi:hypothetical protein
MNINILGITEEGGLVIYYDDIEAQEIDNFGIKHIYPQQQSAKKFPIIFSKMPITLRLKLTLKRILSMIKEIKK